MKLKSTLVLLLLGIICVGGFFLARERFPATQETSEKQKRALNMKSVDVTEVGIKGADRDLLFEKQEGKWNFKKPLQVRASSGEVDGLISSVEYMERLRTLSQKEIEENKLTLADYGLSKPRVTAIFKTKKGDMTLKIGNEARQGDGLYIQVAGDSNVYLVNKAVASRFDKKIEDYRERALFDFTAANTQRLEIKNGAKLMEFSKINTQWRIIQPLNTRADSARIENFLQQTAGLRADDFLSEDPTASKDYGLEEPSQEVSAWVEKQDAPHSLLMGGKHKKDDKKITAKIKGQNSIVTIPALYGVEASKSLTDFRDRHLSAVNASEVAEIELRNRQLVVTLQREGESWKIVQPEKLEADNELVQQFLAKLDSMQIKEFTSDVLTDLEKFGLKSPLSGIILRGKTTVSTESGNTNATQTVLLDFAFGKEDAAKKLAYVKLASESSVYGVESAELSELPREVKDVRSRLLLEIKKDSLKTCTQKKGKSSVVMKQSPDKKWKLGESSQGVLDDTAWLKFQNALEHLRVEKIVGTALNANAKRFGLDEPTAICTVEAEVDGKTVTHEMVIGRDITQKKYHLLLKSQLLVAEISDDLYQTLTRAWVIKPQSK